MSSTTLTHRPAGAVAQMPVRPTNDTRKAAVGGMGPAAPNAEHGTSYVVRPVRSWPVLLLALPAFVAVWSGWVGLGTLTGFGIVRPLPGIADDFTINTAITLPIGVETYAAFALRVWLSGRVVHEGARRFAKWSAIGSLILGGLGQVAYHLLAAAGVTHAPWQITTVVACLPVAVLGMGAALAHLLHNTTATGVGTAGQPASSTQDPAAGGEATHAKEAPVRRPSARKPARRKTPPRKSAPRKLLADYVAEARVAWSPGTEVTPAWVRAVTDCARGTSKAVADALRTELPAPSVARSQNAREAS